MSKENVKVKIERSAFRRLKNYIKLKGLIDLINSLNSNIYFQPNKDKPKKY
jgi:hypothetical protein